MADIDWGLRCCSIYVIKPCMLHLWHLLYMLTWCITLAIGESFNHFVYLHLLVQPKIVIHHNYQWGHIYHYPFMSSLMLEPNPRHYASLHNHTLTPLSLTPHMLNHNEGPLMTLINDTHYPPPRIIQYCCYSLFIVIHYSLFIIHYSLFTYFKSSEIHLVVALGHRAGMYTMLSHWPAASW